MLPLTALRRVLDALISELELNRNLGVDESVADLYTNTISALTNLIRECSAAEQSGRLTQVGLLEQFRTLSEPLVALMERYQREAIVIDERRTTDVETALSALRRPPTNDEERRTIAQLQQLLVDEDPFIREMILREAATNGNDLLLRAATLYPEPPLAIDGARWKPLMSETLKREVRTLVAERLSPGGELAFRSLTLKSLANSVRQALGEAF